ncbi:MAG: GumC family protein [Phycisphaerales bacterium]
MSTAIPNRPSVSGRAPVRRPAPVAVAPPTGAAVDPFKVIRRHLLLLIASVVIGAGVGVGGYIVLLKYLPRYESTIYFKVQPGIRSSTEVGSADAIGEAEVSIIANTELALVLDRLTLERAIVNSDIRSTDWWRDNYGTSGDIQEAIDELQEELKPGVDRGTQLFMLRWSDADRDSVPRVLTAIGDSYLVRSSNLDDERFEKNLTQFQERLEETKTEIANLEDRISQFIRSKGILTLDDPRYNEVMQALNDLVKRIASSASNLAAARSSKDQVDNKLRGVLAYDDQDLKEAEADPSVGIQIRRVQDLKTALRNARDRFTQPDATQVVELENELAAAESVLSVRREEVINQNLQAAQQAVDGQISQLNAVLQSLEDELDSKTEKQTELSTEFAAFLNMNRQMNALEQQRLQDLQLVKEVSLMRAREDSRRVSLWSTPDTPRERSFPKLPIIGPLGVLLVSGLTLGLVFLRELTDRRVRSASDLEVIPGADVLGVVPEVSEDPTRCKAAELAVFRSPQSVMAESYRQITNSLVQTLSVYDLRSLVLTGGMPKSGTTTIISNLGASAAAAGRSVLIIDANFRRPRLAAVMGGDPEQVGLGDVMLGTADVDSVVHEHESGVHWMAAGTPASRIVERLGTNAIDELMPKLLARFDLVMFDTAPAVVAGDALQLASRLDAVALVVRAGEEERGLVSRLVRQFSASSRLAGIVLNRPRGTAGGYFRKNFAAMAAYARKG